MDKNEPAPHRNRRPPAVLLAILLAAVAATGGCTLRGAASSSLMPVSITSPTAVTAPSPAIAVRLPRSGLEAGWQIQQLPSPPAPAASPVPGGDVTAVGDSIMVDGMPNLRALLPGIAIDAVAGRQVGTGLSVVQDLASRGGLQANLVVELGTNGAFTVAQLERVFSLAEGRHVVLLTNHCPYCAWVPANNEMMATHCTADRGCTVADWEALADAHPEWFARDGVHMPIGGVGGQAFAELISSALQQHTPAPHAGPLPGRPLGAARPT